ncbi:hypothetical protein G7054_g3742 [Neopestalotiopsis clavispora]|nr:hypothetical protein G7054_g3742 [Neopestalotiopsis clavispora]
MVYPIEGIQTGLDPDTQKLLREVPVRMEVDKWYLSNKIEHINQRALFFPAFWRFSQMDPHEKLSWFQIAGIHGKPFVAWDEEPQRGATPNRGYCTHNSILFSTWHRPYLLLWEQVIYELMKDEVKKFQGEEDQFLTALESWRFPYWDWALKKPLSDSTNHDYNVPLVIRDMKVQIRQPGSAGLLPYINAFYQFTMPNGITMGDDSLKVGIGGKYDPLTDLRITPSTGPYGTYPFDKCKATSRHPTSTTDVVDWENGKQNNDGIVQNLRDYKWDPEKNIEDSGPRLGNMTASLRDAFYRLTTITKFEDFATKRAPGHGAKEPTEKDFAFDSAENLHDNLHGWCGGDRTAPIDNVSFVGHMSHVPLAAFDPIFWLHHCNVDRLIAIWQMLHDTEWFDGTDARDEDAGTFSIKPYHKDKPTDVLRPFRKNDAGDYWTSDAVSEVTALGYTYPELEKWQYKSPDGTWNKELHLQTLKEYLNRNYNSSWSAAEKSELTADPGQTDGLQLASLSALTVHKEPIDLIGVDDYVINVIYEKFALKGKQFTIHVFVGHVPEQVPYTFQEPGTQVGQVINFSMEAPPSDDADGCGNCAKQAASHSEATGRVVLTNALITRWKNQIEHVPADPSGPSVLGGMDPENVVKFLKHHLHWRVTSSGQLVEPTDIPSLKVSLAVGKADHFADRAKMSKFYNYNAAYDVTQGRPNGAGPEDGLYPPGALYSLPQ